MNELAASAAVIVDAERAAEAMLKKTENRYDGLRHVTREDVIALAKHTMAVAAIASKYIRHFLSTRRTEQQLTQ